MLARRRDAAPIAPKPATNIAHVAGSGIVAPAIDSTAPPNSLNWE